MEYKFISVIIPIYNEEKYIVNCVDSLLLQDYPKEYMEWIFVDGMSTDATVSIVLDYIKINPELIKLYFNENKTVPYAMNIGIKRAKGDYIIRLDAHAEYSNNYLSMCVELLNETDADNVGGVADTKGNGFVGCTIAKMLSSRFGVGNSKFRTCGKDGYVDTVPFGAFRKEVFKKYGLYDERLTRNQDNEMNYRIRKNGGKIFLSNKIKLSYYCRDSVKGISNMAFKNGLWNIITMKLCPGSMGLRHFIPLIFVLSLIFLPVLNFHNGIIIYVLSFELILYLALDIFYSFKQSKNIIEILLLIILFPIFHIFYGLGSLIGIYKLCTGNFR